MWFDQDGNLEITNRGGEWMQSSRTKIIILGTCGVPAFPVLVLITCAQMPEHSGLGTHRVALTACDRQGWHAVDERAMWRTNVTCDRRAWYVTDETDCCVTVPAWMPDTWQTSLIVTWPTTSLIRDRQAWHAASALWVLVLWAHEIIALAAFGRCYPPQHP